MIRVRRWKAFLFLLALLPIASQSQVTIFENSTIYSGKNARIGDEYGDEVIFANGPRVITKLRFEYVGDFYPNGDETGRLRIYSNTGPDWKGNSSYPTPGQQPLWESSAFPLRQGFTQQEFVVPSIRVSDKMTWTVQFSGLSMATNVVTPNPAVTNDFAGLLFYGTPSIGVSFNDFWQKLIAGWTPVRVDGPPKNNFGVSITAIPEATVPRLRVSTYNGYLRVSWPGNVEGYTLYSRTLANTNWYPTPPPALISNTFERLLPFTAPNLLVQLRKSAQPTNVEPQVSIDTLVHIRWPTNVTGKVLQTKLPLDVEWRDLPTPAAPTGANYEVLLPLAYNASIFRLRETLYAASLEITRQNQNFRLRWPKTATGYRIQQSTPLTRVWLSVTEPVTESDNYFECLVPITPDSKIFRLFNNGF